jgi:hypothetical protein
MVFKPSWPELKSQLTEQIFCSPQSKEFVSGCFVKTSADSQERALTARSSCELIARVNTCPLSGLDGLALIVIDGGASLR